MCSLPGLATTRRTTVGGAIAGLLALAGCDAGGLEPGKGRTPGAAPAEEVDDPDAALVDRVIDELDELEALVRSAARERPALAPRLAGLGAAHRAHRAVLPERRSSRPRVVLPRRPRELLAEVLRRERVGQDRLADWALEAQSGALARLLASMSAGIAAHLAADPADPGGAA